MNLRYYFPINVINLFELVSCKLNSWNTFLEIVSYVQFDTS